MSPLRWGLALSGWAALAVVVLLPDALVLRIVVTTAFLLVCPGLAGSRWARPGPARVMDRTAVLERGVLALTVSMSAAVLVVGPLFLSGWFTVTRALLALAVVTSVLALLPGPGGRRRGAPRAAPAPAPAPGPAPGPRAADAGRPEPPPPE
ncbi:hypothetical protein [Streptomyces sp. NPDC093094]|uniref:hypothetical protein n=1 Tax=Streptomyces sp. NPDC093094 TaxID=3366026 RepID=UPI003825B6A4